MCLKYAGAPVNLLPCLGYISFDLLQKSGVSVTKLWDASRYARVSALLSPKMKAAPPHAAVYSRASCGLPCAVSAPMAMAYLCMPLPTRPMHACIASVPALHANSKSAVDTFGVAPITSATMVPLGLTA